MKEFKVKLDIPATMYINLAVVRLYTQIYFIYYSVEQYYKIIDINNTYRVYRINTI